MSGKKGMSTGGHNKLPTAIKELKGTLKPSRQRAARMKPPLGVPRPEKWLKGLGRQHYATLAKLVAPLKVCALCDGPMLSMTAAALAEYDEAAAIVERDGQDLRRETENGVTFYAHPATRIAADAWRRVREGLRSFGLDPQSRDSVAVIDDTTATDPNADFFNDTEGKLQ
jgi:P27 family predicted phage terminase small subunit